MRFLILIFIIIVLGCNGYVDPVIYKGSIIANKGFKVYSKSESDLYADTTFMMTIHKRYTRTGGVVYYRILYTEVPRTFWYQYNISDTIK